MAGHGFGGADGHFGISAEGALDALCFQRVTQRRDGSFRSAGDHHVSVTTLDDLVSVPDSMCACGASGACGFIGPFGAVTDAYVPSSKVHDGSRNEKRRDLARPTGKKRRMFA